MKPLVSIVCGSDSDLPKLESAFSILKDFGIPYEVRIISAHRTPEDAAEFARSAEERGVRVIIAAAGAAAHLGGVLASFTPLPVIGVPIASGALNGLDSLLSMVQMPPGVPVGTGGIDGGRNACILAAQILGVADEGMRAKVAEYKRKQAGVVREKDRKAQEAYNK